MNDPTAATTYAMIAVNQGSVIYLRQNVAADEQCSAAENLFDEIHRLPKAVL